MSSPEDMFFDPDNDTPEMDVDDLTPPSSCSVKSSVGSKPDSQLLLSQTQSQECKTSDNQFASISMIQNKGKVEENSEETKAKSFGDHSDITKIKVEYFDSSG